MGVLGPNESSIGLSGCQDDTVGQRLPKFAPHFGLLESNARTQSHHMPLVHDGSSLECSILTPLLMDAFEHLRDTNSWNDQAVDIFDAWGIKVSI